MGENIYADPSVCVFAHINTGVICAFSRIRSPPATLLPSSKSAFYVSILPSENVASLKQFPLSHYLMCENRLPLAGAEDARSGHELAAKRGAGSSPNSLCLDPTVPTGLDTWGWLLGQLATEGCNQSL